jgi:2-keto-4-pentenoate hydratase/2-oxohepta-3-ene-1,7-dioic acid hydratase in catechol pathway
MRIARVVAEGVPRYVEVEDDSFHPLSWERSPTGALPASPKRMADAPPLTGVKVESPVDPDAMFAVLGGFNLEGAPPLDERPPPMLCPKVVRTVSGDGGTIVFPSFADSVVIEAEMAVVIGERVRGASPDEARDAIWGYTCFNDITAPQFYPQFYLSKSIETFASMGPWVRTDLTDEDFRRGLEITARVNGATVQSGNTRHYKFMPCEMVSYLSTFLTLQPGDVIALGTPPPGADVVPGDEVEIEVEGIGMFTNHVISETGGDMG